MDPSRRKIPVTLMLDAQRLSAIETLAQGSDKSSMSKIVRLAVDRLVGSLGGPESPDLAALRELLKATD